VTVRQSKRAPASAGGPGVRGSRGDARRRGIRAGSVGPIRCRTVVAQTSGSLPVMATLRANMSPKPVPKRDLSSRLVARQRGSTVFKPVLPSLERLIDDQPPPCQGGARLYQIRQQKIPVLRGFLKPSDGLEPSTPSLPWRIRASATGPMNGAC